MRNNALMFQGHITSKRCYQVATLKALPAGEIEITRNDFSLIVIFLSRITF